MAVILFGQLISISRFLKHLSAWGNFDQEFGFRVFY